MMCCICHSQDHIHSDLSPHKQESDECHKDEANPFLNVTSPVNMTETTPLLKPIDPPDSPIEIDIEFNVSNMTNPVTFNNLSMFESTFQCLIIEYDDINDTLSIDDANDIINNTESKEEKPPNKGKTKRFNYASFDSGALVLSTSEGIQSAKSILLNRQNKYMMMPCGDMTEKWFIVQLSEDIVIDRIEISNFEHYSSNLKRLKISAQTQQDDVEGDEVEDDIDENWILISDFEMNNTNTNEIQFVEKHHVRWLKIEILSHYGSEYYCTLTQV